MWLEVATFDDMTNAIFAEAGRGSGETPPIRLSTSPVQSVPSVPVQCGRSARVVGRRYRCPRPRRRPRRARTSRRRPTARATALVIARAVFVAVARARAIARVRAEARTLLVPSHKFLQWRLATVTGEVVAGDASDVLGARIEWRAADAGPSREAVRLYLASIAEEQGHRNAIAAAHLKRFPETAQVQITVELLKPTVERATAEGGHGLSSSGPEA